MISDPHKLFRILAEVTQAVQTGEDLDGVLLGILASITRVFRARGCTLRTLDPLDNELKLRAATGLSRGYLDKGPVAADRSLSEIHDNEPVIIRNVEADPRVQYPDAAAAEGIVSIVGIPFEILGSYRMVLRLYFDAEVDPGPDAIEVLRILAGQGAIAIRNALTQTRYLDTFRRVSASIHSGNDITDILNRIVREITEVMAALGCIYWIVNVGRRRIENRVCHGFHYRSLTAADYDAIDRVFEVGRGKTVYVEDVRYDTKVPDLEMLGKRRVRSLVGIPFRIAEPYVGILAVYFSSRRRLIQREFDFLNAVGEQGAISLHRCLRYDEERLAALRRLVAGLVLALEAKDPSSYGHSLRVAHCARRTGEAMGMSGHDVERLYHAGLLHDIGTIGGAGPDPVHPVVGARMLSPLGGLDEVVRMVRHHREHFDGTGAPDGLAGEEIPVGARILGVCNALENLLSGRSGGARLPLRDALDSIRSGAGTRFDPEVVWACAALLEADPSAIKPAETPESYWDRLRDDLAGAGDSDGGPFRWTSRTPASS